MNFARYGDEEPTKTNKNHYEAFWTTNRSNIMEAKRKAIETLLRAGLTTTAIVSQTNSSRVTVWRVKNRMNDGVGMDQGKGSGRKQKLTKIKVAGLKRSIKADPTKSMRQHARRLNVSDSTVRSALKKRRSKVLQAPS